MKDSIDIILPVYNGEAYITESIESILNQTYSNFNLLVINDGSTDKTKLILEQLKNTDARIQVINKDNEGLIATLNLGISLSRAKYLVRMDHDDILAPSKLEMQINYMNSHENIDVLGCNAFLIDSSGKRVGSISFPVASLAVKAKSFVRVPVLHPSVMIKVSDKIRPFLYYDEAQLYCEDFGLWHRLLDNDFRITNLKEKLMYYRMHNSSVSSTRREDMQNNACQIIENAMKNTGISLEQSDWESFKILRNKELSKNVSLISFFSLLMRVGGCKSLRFKFFIKKELVELFLKFKIKRVLK
ncbi:MULTISPECIES: glycosyltransferase family 2 protein [Pseudoalteromonas]|uniref:glycosyltransferase family 2 protein n=1 Tax=Pseudoalteromonas TaxID=53246 RepID=UPI00069157B6|nr:MULTISPECIES: glycosyltransferase family 2 protein [Pseudoalteromonas]